MTAMKMPKKTDEEQKARHTKMQEGLKKAITVPFSVMTISDSCWEYMIKMAKDGNISSASDLEVGAKSLETGIWGAYKNVLINLNTIEDEAYKSDMIAKGEEIVKNAEKNCKKVCSILAGR